MRVQKLRGTCMSEEKNQNVVVIQDNNENKKTNKLSWYKLAKGIARKKWWVIGSTLIVGFVGLASVQWGFNLLREKLVANYSYSLATNIDSNGEERFINGQVFDYAMVVKKDVMQSIKDGNEQYKRINIDKIIKESAISVTRNVVLDSENDKDSKHINYTLSAKSRYFPSKEIGRQFLTDLVNAPLELSKNIINEFSVTSYITDGFDSMSYLKKNDVLKKQYTELKTAYQTLETKFTKNVIGTDGKTLGQLIGDFDNATYTVDTALTSMYVNGFVEYEASKKAERLMNLRSEGESLALTLKSQQNLLNAKNDLLTSMANATIVSTLAADSEYEKEIIALKNEIVNITNEITKLEQTLTWAGFYETTEGNWVFDDTPGFDHNKTSAYYRLSTEDASWVTANTTYATELAALSEVLKVENTEATSIYRHIYSTNNQVSILNSGYAEVKNNIHWAIGLAVGLLLGFIVSSLVVGEIEVYRKEEE